ncbi:MAG: hypothetical protein PHF40_02240 [Candidatus Pacebacteria bacterium]|nr:hypothetical protein [Candidatus Paceibacterota bacterium]
MQKETFLSLIIILTLVSFSGINFKIQAQESVLETTPTIVPSENLTTNSSKIITPTFMPIPTVLPINIKYINDKDLKQSLVINEIKGRSICKFVGGCPNVEKNGEVEISIKAAIVTSVADNYLKVKIFDIDYEVDLSRAKTLRYQWTPAQLDDFVVGDVVNVYGFLNQDNRHLIQAETVRNISLQKNVSVLGGIIRNPIDNTFTLLTENSGSVKVFVSDDTKINQAEAMACIMIYPPVNCPRSTSTPITFNDLKDGERAIVRGVWNKDGVTFNADQIIIGNDGRPFFNKKMELEKTQNQNNLEEEIRNQIKILQERIKDIQDQLKMQLF